MSFVLPATKAKGGSKGGRGPWKAGEKLWNNAVVHKSQEFLKKYAGKATVGVDGRHSCIILH